MIGGLIVGGLMVILGVGLIRREDGREQMRWGLIGTMGLLIGIIGEWGKMRGSGMEGIESYRWLGQVVILGVDGLSMSLLLLTGLLMPISLLVSSKGVGHMLKEYVICLVMVEVLLIGVFTAMDVLVFYVVFEGVVIPMYMMIGIWGKRPERVMAAYYLLMYTLVGSVMFIIGIMGVYGALGVTDMGMMRLMEVNGALEEVIYVGVTMAMGVKIPMVPVHIWLPQAHVEAPLAGSIILAGLLLKIGGYGMMRLTWGIAPHMTNYYGPVVQTLGVLAVIYGGLTTCRQVDIKRAIAYASISHMGIVTLGIYSGTMEGMIGAMYMMVSHGLISSGLFISAGMLYDRYSTRLIRYMRGQWVVMPVYSIYGLLLWMGNAGVPISSGYIGELQVLVGVYRLNEWLGMMGAVGMVISAGYSFHIYNRMTYGVPMGIHRGIRDVNRREGSVLMVMVVMIYGLGLWPWLITEDIALGIQAQS